GQIEAAAPGSPKSGCSRAVSASASASSTESAPSASNASARTCAWPPSTTSVTRSQAMRARLGLRLDGLERGDLLLQVVDVHAATDEGRVVHELLVQRDVGLDSLDHHFRKGDPHARDRLLAVVAV